jgi:hypothetical protein
MKDKDKMEKVTFKKTIFDEQGHTDSVFLWVWSGHTMGFPPGSFSECLIEAFLHADGDNQARLGAVYPCYAEAYRKCQNGDLERAWRKG